LKVMGLTDTGIVRKTNQDDFACGLFESGCAWAVVCDGMGGASGGSVASGTAVKIISEKLKTGFDGNIDMAFLKHLLQDAINAANTEVFSISCNDSTLFGMGTTVIVAIVTPYSVYISHAGDSRGYLISPTGAVQLTRDHSIVQDMLENGKLTSEEARQHPQKNIITRALGIEKTLNIDFCEATFADNCTLLLCTDGLTNHLEDQIICDIISSKDVTDAPGALVSLANEYGGTDNITVVVVAK
jgi:serine/threonine protein phosphatase PrpC